VNAAGTPRDTRRRAEHDRQTVVFGVILSVLAVSAMIGAAVYTNAVHLPFLNRAFTTDDPAVAHPLPCVDAGTLPVTPAEVTVTVLNGTTKSGLASQASDQLTSQYGFAVTDPANSGEAATGTAVITFGPQAVAQAYTLLLYVPEATMQFDKTISSTGVKLTLGEDFTTIAEGTVIDPTAPLESLDDTCVPLTSLVATPA
jgi:hypothetical protein